MWKLTTEVPNWLSFQENRAPVSHIPPKTQGWSQKREGASGLKEAKAVDDHNKAGFLDTAGSLHTGIHRGCRSIHWPTLDQVRKNPRMEAAGGPQRLGESWGS